MKRTQQDTGTISRKKRSKGPDIWVWRVYLKDELGIVHKKSFILGTVQEWPTEAHAWKGSSEKRQALLGETFGKLVERYKREALSERYSTRSSYLSRLKMYILPKWQDVLIGEVKPYDAEQWLKDIPRSPKTKSHIRGIMHLLFEHAMKWEMLGCQRNPMELVKIKGVTKRTRKRLIITVEQFHSLLPLLPSHVRMMVVLAMCTGMRISEILALRWIDIDFEQKLLTIRRSIVSKYVADATKSDESADDIPLDHSFIGELRHWKSQCLQVPEGWLFANIDTKRPFHASPLQQDHIRPAGRKVGIMGLGWHTFRHSYRTMIDDLGTPVGVQQRLMRHADIRTTMNVYGSAFEETKRRVNARIAEMVLPPASDRVQ
ncbi:MAG TPA: site-specific integrase [Verrucomicrobiae bacterium]|nr:site-specific integrase [Verrucomicrobiae bacterium]